MSPVNVYSMLTYKVSASIRIRNPAAHDQHPPSLVWTTSAQWFARQTMIRVDRALFVVKREWTASRFVRKLEAEYLASIVGKDGARRVRLKIEENIARRIRHGRRDWSR